ncbi:MAG: tetratricopeptide repeat-containing protein, partial [Chloroflexi bacterium]|nr:tetratricopeptide repeat-containing protein [Chloroflexota bacterium]
MPHNHRQDLELLLDAQYKRRLDCMKLIAVTTSPTKKAEFELEKAKIEENIQQLEQQLEQLPPPPTATYFRYNYLNLTDTEGVLIGRQAALEELAELLAKGGCVAICAVGGQGKTALAYNYLKLHLKGPPRFEALLWLTIVGDGSDLTGLLALLGLNPAGQRPEEMAEAVRFYLADHLVLVVLDNFEAAIRQDGTLPLDIEALLRRIAEFRGQSHILITTREMPPPYRPQILPLTGLTPEAGADLLAERGLRKEPRSRLLKVATKAEGNPFALKILADLVTDPFMRDTLENLLRQGQLWDQELSERLLRKVWETRLSQEEHRLLQLLALLRPPVRRATLLALLTLASEASERQLEQGLRNLAHKSLVTLERDSPQMPIGYDLHPLLRRFVLNEKLSATECKALNQQAAAYFQTLLSSLPPSENYGRKSVHDVWPILEAIYHLNQLGDYQAATDLFFEEGLWEDLDRWGVATTLLELYREWAFPFTSYAWCNKRTLERILGNLGNAYADLGRVEEAIGYYEQALAISREIK